MAHTICGIDLGSFSVKLVLLEVGLRQTRLRGRLEAAVGQGEAPLIERQAEALREALSQVSGEATLYVALPGELLSLRLLELPFTDPRKIEQVVGYELEGQIVHALDDVVYDHMVVRTTAEGSSVFAAAAKIDDVRHVLDGLDKQAIGPRALYAAPVVYHALLPSAGEAGGQAGGCHAVIDIGHLRTNLCMVRDGRCLYARTIMRGGVHLTEAIAKAFSSAPDRAEQAKRSDAFLASAARPATTPLAIKLDAVLREALAPLVRDIRQTFASFRASTKESVGRIFLTGGTGQLRGLTEYLRLELGVPVGFLPVRAALDGRPAAATGPDADFEPAVDEETESSSYAQAASIALAASRGRKELDLRRGPFVYKASFSALRQKAGHLAMLAAALVLALGLDVYAAMSNLGNERRELDVQLKRATQELFGQPRQDAAAITVLLKKGIKEEIVPVPKATAFDLLDQISRKMPSDDKISLDVMELDIRPKKTFIKGTVDSAAAVDEISTRLKEIDCFEQVTKGAVTEVSGGAKQFTLTVASKCP